MEISWQGLQTNEITLNIFLRWKTGPFSPRVVDYDADTRYLQAREDYPHCNENNPLDEAIDLTSLLKEICPNGTDPKRISLPWDQWNTHFPPVLPNSPLANVTLDSNRNGLLRFACLIGLLIEAPLRYIANLFMHYRLAYTSQTGRLAYDRFRLHLNQHLPMQIITATLTHLSFPQK